MKPVKELVAVARAQPARALPDETRQSLPIPVIAGGRVGVSFLYATSVANPRVGLQLVTPSYLGTVDAATGRFEGLRRIRPQALGLDHSEGEFIGAVTLPPGLTVQDYLARQEEMFQELDVLLPAFAAQDLGGTGIRTSAVRFHALFDLIAEPPLVPYYQAVGSDFFTWLDRVAANAG